MVYEIINFSKNLVVYRDEDFFKTIDKFEKCGGDCYLLKIDNVPDKFGSVYTKLFKRANVDKYCDVWRIGDVSIEGWDFFNAMYIFRHSNLDAVLRGWRYEGVFPIDIFLFKRNNL